METGLPFLGQGTPFIRTQKELAGGGKRELNELDF